MGVCIERLPHSCGSSDALQVFENEEGSFSGYCFSCGTYEDNPYQSKPKGFKPKIKKKTKKDIAEEMEFISSFMTVDLSSRMLDKKYLEYFEVKVAVKEEDGSTPSAYYLPYKRDGVLTGYKVKLVEEKRMWSVGDCSRVDLFGWQQAVMSGAKRLIITEGEEDAIALFQVIKEDNKNGAYAEFNPAIVSIPHGAASALKDISKLIPAINKHFKEIVIVFDKDDAGKKASSEVVRILPEAMTAELPCKDANECLKQGYKKAMIKATVWQASKPKNSRLVWGRELHEEACTPAEWGVSYPWEALTDLTRGIRKGETIYLGAGVKMGKSEVVNALASHIITEHGWKVLLAKPEESNLKSYKMMAGKVVGRVFHDPKIEFDKKAYEDAGLVLKDNLCMINLYQHLGWETLKSDIVSAVSEGVDAVFIDPITNLTNGMSSSDANTALQDIAQSLAAMAKDLNIVIFIFCHLRNPSSGEPHDRGGAVLSHQFAGSRAMSRSCNYTFGLQGNKDPELSTEERNVRKIVILDDREYGESGVVDLYWDNKTGLFSQI